MSILKKLLPMVGLLLPSSLSATDYQWLTFKMTDNTEVSVLAENLSVNYSDNTLFLKSETVDEAFSVAQIHSMRFTTSMAGISDAVEIGQEMNDYYNVSGVKVGRFASVEEARRGLPSGIYVAKSETKSLKVIF